MLVEHSFTKGKKRKNLTDLQRKNLKKISKFNKEVLQESLPDIFILEKIQNNMPLRHEANNPLFLSTKITKDDNFFLLFLGIMCTFSFYTGITSALKYIKLEYFSSVFPQLVYLFTNTSYFPTCRLFGSTLRGGILQNSVHTIKHYLVDTSSNDGLSFVELCFLL